MRSRLLAVALCLFTPVLIARQQDPQASAIGAAADEFMRSAASSGGASGLTFEQVRERARAATSLLSKLDAIDTAKLTHDDWITHALLTFEAELQRDAEKFYWLDFRVTPYASPLARNLTARFSAMPVATADERLAYLDALYQLPQAIEAHQARLRSQTARGIVLPEAEIELVVPFIHSIVADPASSPFAVAPARLAAVPEAERNTFRAAVDEAIATAIVPSVSRLAAFIDGPYRARAVKDVGVGQYPSGRDYYQHLIRRHTGTNLTPEQIHRIGLDEVARLERELDSTRAAAGFTGSLADFRQYLKTDRRFFPTGSDEFATLMMAAIRRIEPKVDAYFEKKPKAPYGVLRLEPALEPSMTYGFYQAPSAADPRGLYRFNGSKPDQRSTLTMAPLIYHELVPGHHFQIGLRNETAGLSPFRRAARYTSYNEGWAEYAADLAGEMGMYGNPFDRAGRIAQNLFLTTRLVVDTGMNALGWTRERAIAFMRDHTLEAEVQIETETLRYSTDIPGQALAYKIGGFKIHELRRRAQTAMGAAFDIRRFHSQMLDSGAMPVEVLEQHMACFIGGEKHQR